MPATLEAPAKTRATVTFPEEVRERFLLSGGLTFRDGSSKSAEEIWDFLTVEGPRRFPNLFTKARLHGLSGDWDLISGIKRTYLQVSIYDRLNRAVADGVPVVLIQGGQGHEPYYAAGAIPVRPGHLNAWATNIKEGMSFEEADQRRLQIREGGRQHLTVDACQTAKYEIIQPGLVPVAMVAPYLANRCSDIAYGLEAHRHGPIRLPLLAVDVPVDDQDGKEWARDYVAGNLRTLLAQVSGKSGKKGSAEDLREEIKLHNKKRRLAREYADLWWNAKVPPTSSQDHLAILGLGNESHGDPVAALQVLEESLAEVRQRVLDGVKGHGLQDDPARLFVCGSCVNPNLKHVDSVGGVVVGKDDGWSEIYHDIDEEIDPYLAVADSILAYPYEQPSQERGRWTARQAERARADGLLFMYQWGCNYQSGIARLVADVVREEAGIPTAIIERAMAESQVGNEQLNGRVETFIEILR